MNHIRALLIGMAALAAGSTMVATADAATLYGEAQKLGNDFARVFAELTRRARPP